jgi:5-formyltetrahydrofolate cyclo-ligase
MGAGYYDKTFAFLHEKTEKKPLLVGLAFECQKTDALPHDEWDIKLDAVLTEKNIYMFRNKNSE